jgi:crotonobetainyl-CoA:carnitine CoA-transferase CaiB-like acyl-CoA transferase
VPAPLLGQHNREVAASLGFSGGEIDAMERDGVLYAEPSVQNLK